MNSIYLYQHIKNFYTRDVSKILVEKLVDKMALQDSSIEKKFTLYATIYDVVLELLQQRLERENYPLIFSLLDNSLIDITNSDCLRAVKSARLTPIDRQYLRKAISYKSEVGGGNALFKNIINRFTFSITPIEHIVCSSMRYCQNIKTGKKFRAYFF